MIEGCNLCATLHCSFQQKFSNNIWPDYRQLANWAIRDQGPTQPPMQWVSGVAPAGVKQHGREAD
jgi:hypothetical protein